MRKCLLLAVCMYTTALWAQNNTASNLIEGGKTLVELVRIFKTPKNNVTANTQTAPLKTDSCTIKNTSDLCFKNTTAKSLYVSLFKRNGNNYEANVLTIKILPKTQECWYELKAGIYKFKIEVDGEDDKKVVYREGEMKLLACENVSKEIKTE
jgi:hypothetical protein